MKNFYQLLSVAADAPADEIKKAFRREIARYHPDKVQHLGKEFQEMASGMAADLTEAYRILMDPALRAQYNEHLFEGAPPQAMKPPRPAADQAHHATQSAASASSPPVEPYVSSPGPPPLPRPSKAGVDFMRKASLSRLKEAVAEVMGDPEPRFAEGFDLVVTSRPKRGLFKKADDKVRLLVKYVPHVDGEAIAAIWVTAARLIVPDAVLCVLLVGPGLAPANDLAAAITEQRRKNRNAGPVLVPVDVRDWEALFPPDTPASVRSLVQRLKDDTR